ncbi:MAG: hypothetical protein M3314_05725 [Actinomycetota bacterium]|nr:hypothetical protein [Actinomycetota bacterium]
MSRRLSVLALSLVTLLSCTTGDSAELSSPAPTLTTVVTEPTTTASTALFAAPPTTVRTIASIDECSPIPQSVGLPDAGQVEHAGPVTIFFEDNVTAVNRDRVRAGLAAGQQFIADVLGGFRFREPICLDVRAGGTGSNTVGVVFGANHIVLYTGARPVDGGPAWLLAHVTAHELMHFWQKDIGNPRDGVGPVWLLEGAAELLGYEAVIAAGLATEPDTRNFSLRRVPRDVPSLESMEQRPDDPSQFSYPLCFLAAEFLTAERGPLALRDYWRLLSRGRDWESAFTEAFGVGPTEFYLRFEAYRGRGFQ